MIVGSVCTAEVDRRIIAAAMAIAPALYRESGVAKPLPAKCSGKRCTPHFLLCLGDG